MKKSFIVLIILISNYASSQRWFAINDSTSYSFQGINITVGRNKIYRNLNNTLTLIRDFSTNNPQIQEDYIRDFDFIDENTWYVLVGSRYIGQKTELYKTNDAGLIWELITPQSFTVPSNLDGIADSINQIQFLDGRIYLFDTYYTSRVFYSDDLGQTWTHWFECFWSHYYQIYGCGNDLYIHGLAGDGFRPYMLQIPPSYFGQQNIFTTNVGGCNNTGTEGCYHAPANITVPEVFEYFKNLFDTTICNSLGMTDTIANNLKVFPNPIIDYFTLVGVDTSQPFSIKVYNNLGQLCFVEKNKVTVDFSTLPHGGYYVSVTQEQINKTVKVYKQ